MAPLTLDDLLPLDEYASRRQEFFQTHRRYIDRYRRVRIGPAATVIFENRQTLWFKVHELQRVARLADPRRLEQELSWYNRLLPARDGLNATLILEGADADGSSWRELADGDVRLLVDALAVSARVTTSRPEDRCVGASHWLEWRLSAKERDRLADHSRGARLEIEAGEYRHASSPLGASLRQSLLDDLLLSDRDVGT